MAAGTVGNVHQREGTRARPPAVLAPALLTLLAGAVAWASAFAAPPGSVAAAVVVAGGCALLAVLGLTLWRYDVAVVVAVLLLAVVQVEPAPVDAVLAVLVTVGLITGRVRLGAPPVWLVALVGGLIGLTLLSLIGAVDLARGVSFAGITIYLLVFALWTADYVDTAGRARSVVTAFVAVATGSAVLGGLSVLTGVGASVLTHYSRAQALFKDPNVFGPFLVAAAVLVLGELIDPRLLRWPAWVKALAFAALGCGVLFSYSRAAWLNMAVAVAVVGVVALLRRGGGRRLMVITLAGIGGLAVIAGTVVLTGSLPFLQERAQLQPYDADRFAAQELGLRLGESHPIGIGPGQFEIVAPISSHSTYVRVLAEQGPGGLVLLLLLLAGTLWLAVRHAVAGTTTCGIGSATLLGLWCGLLANSFFVDTLHWRHLWLVAGLIWAAAVARRGARVHGSPDGLDATPA